MKFQILLTITILTGCSARKEPAHESKISRDTTTTARIESVAEVKTNFLFDTLLTFDSESDLKKAFGDNIKHSIGYYPEGMGQYPNTLLFPGTKNEVEFVWHDTIEFKKLAYLQIAGKETDWKTKEGITIGTTLKELEKLNQKSFTFYGFGWDYSGAVSWDNGHLEEREVFVSLEFPGETIPPEFDEMLGDHTINSNSELAQKANPIVADIRMMR